MTVGQVIDYTGAAARLGSPTKAEWLLADRGYYADWFRDALQDEGIRPCIPGWKPRGKPIQHDKRCNRIETIFGRLKAWRRVATCYDRCPKVLLSAVALAATVMFWRWNKNESWHYTGAARVDPVTVGRHSIKDGVLPSRRQKSAVVAHVPVTPN